MKRAALGLVAALALVAAAAVLAVRSGPPGADLGARSRLLMLTSLPLVFGEEFSIADHGSPALGALEEKYEVIPIDSVDAEILAASRLLLMAQPRALPPGRLVALDRWVRDGGRLVLLADPMLEWPSSRPLGDPGRPPPMFADTGLLAHWGLRLDTPERRGQAEGRVAGHAIATTSPGTLHGTDCAISPDRLVADCLIGKGRAVIVADADFLNVEAHGSANLAALSALIGEVDSADSRAKPEKAR